MLLSALGQSLKYLHVINDHNYRWTSTMVKGKAYTCCFHWSETQIMGIQMDEVCNYVVHTYVRVHYTLWYLWMKLVTTRIALKMLRGAECTGTSGTPVQTLLRSLTFRGPCIVIYYNKTNKMLCFSNLFW